MRIIRPDQHRRMPWRNGGGETIEIAVCPEGAGLDAFDWRVSMARVGADGPFSLFPSVDRTLAILDGAGLRLEVAGCPFVDLIGATPPWSFPADQPTTATLLGGPVLDLNVMSRRGAFRHAVERLALADVREVAVDGAPVLLLCWTGDIAVETGDATTRLGPGDTLLVDRGVARRWRLAPTFAATAYLIQFRHEPEAFLQRS